MIEIIIDIPKNLFESYAPRVLSGGGVCESLECLEAGIEALGGGGYTNAKLDLLDDFTIQITRSIADIKEPQSRSSDWSKTITLPGTKNNNRIFSHIFEVGNEITGTSQLAPDFNPNKKANVVVLVDGMEQIRGFIRLTEIVVNDSKDIIYNATIHGQTADLFTSLENAKLSDLNFSEYNHTMNITNVIDSWDNQIYVDGSPTSFAYGQGYVWMQPLPKHNVANVDKWRVDDHIPCLYAKTVIDKIFSSVGYTYTSDSFFNTDRFKRLVLPYQYGAASASGVTNRLFQASINSNTTLTSGDRIPFANDSTGGNFDNGGNWDATTYEYTAPDTAEYNFNLTIGLPTYGARDMVVFRVYQNSTLVRNIFLYGNSTSDSFDIQLIKNDVLYIEFYELVDLDTNISSSSVDIAVPSTIYNASKSNLLGYNNTIDFSQFFSGEYTQKDLLLNFVKMFNLYIEDTDSKQLRIVPRDDFYDGDNVNWSAKLDYSQPTQIIPMGDLQSNPYKFTFKDTDDEENKLYKEQYDRVYGDRVVRIDNDFIKTEKLIDVTFSPTIMMQEGTRYYSHIPKGDANLRVLYYGGAATTSAYYTFNQTPGTANTTKYPVTLHIDDPSDMQFDLCFGIPQSTKTYIGFEYSNQNLVNEYYFKTIIEIADKDSKIFKGYFRITPNDWVNLKFNNLYFFENQYWRLNKVTDYTPLEDGVFECEFLLATYYQPFARNTGAVGVGGYDGSGVQGDYFPTEGRGGFLGTSSGGVNIGDNQGDDDNISTGDGNNVQGTYNTVLGGTNTGISRDFQNVTAIRCTDFSIPESDRVYVENQPVLGTWLGSGKVVTIDNTDSPYTPTYDDWLILCDTSGGSIDVVLPDPTNNSGKMYVIKKIDASNQVDITAGDGSILIDDATTHSSNAKNGYDQVVSDGTQYWIITHGH